MANDIVRDLLRRLQLAHPEIPADEWRRHEHRFRQDWGGERVYVLKAPSEGKALSLAWCLAAGASWNEALRATRICRRTGYRVRPWGLP
jgi:hypothetical protein